MNRFVLKGREYRCIPADDGGYAVVDENDFPMVHIKNLADAESAMRDHINHCEDLVRRGL